MNTTPSGLQYEDTVVGEGAEATPGQDVHKHLMNTTRHEHHLFAPVL